MLGRGNQDALFLQAGCITHTSHVAADGLNFKAIQINAAKDDTGSSRCRQDPEIDRSPAMQPNSTTANRSANCLFKHQVVSDEQITPWTISTTVVFLPHSVALPTNPRLTEQFCALPKKQG